MFNKCDVCGKSMEKYYFGLYHPGYNYVSPYASLSDMVAASRPVAPVSIHLCKCCYDEVLVDYDVDDCCSKVEMMISIQARFNLSDVQVCQFMFEPELQHFFTLKGVANE